MKKLRLLIIEDSVDDTFLIVRELQKGGYMITYERVETEHTLKKALFEDHWDLIISDHSLPFFSAPAALHVLKESGIDLPFIIVSGTIGDEVAVAAMREGAHDYVMKDNLSRLVAVVERSLSDAENRARKRRVELALRESEARFKRLAENAPDLIYLVRLLPERKFEYVSPSAEALTGYTPDEHYANPNLGYEIIHPDDRHLLEAVSRGEKSITEPLVLRWIKKDGDIVWTEQRNVPVYDTEKNMVAIEGIARDVTESVLKEQQLKDSNKQVKALSEKILQALEDERKRLALELHDELGQALTAVKLDLQVLGSLYPVLYERENRLQQSIKLIDHTIDMVRRESCSLRPPVLDDMGLVAAVKEMVAGFQARTGVKVFVSCNGLKQRFTKTVETTIYRCAQESLTNVYRHARANKVTIDISYINDQLSLKVSDDGVGFSPGKTKIADKHFGLLGMQERVSLIDGDFKVISEPGSGTTINVSAPCYPRGE